MKGTKLHGIPVNLIWLIFGTDDSTAKEKEACTLCDFILPQYWSLKQAVANGQAEMKTCSLIPGDSRTSRH